MATGDRVYATVVQIRKGIITLIENDGSLGFYRQRGLNRLSEADKMALVQSGYLDSRYKDIRELPSKYRLKSECEEITGKPRVTFKVPKSITR